MQHSRLWCLVLAAVTSTSVAAQQTWIVDSARGAGWHFEAIQPAVDAASPGDTILVRGLATGTNYDGATISKGVTVIAAGRVLFITPLRITAVPTGERAALVGMLAGRVAGQFGETISQGNIECTACLGTVHLENVSVVGSSRGPGLSIQRCSQVSAVDCQLMSAVSTYFDPFLGRAMLEGSGPGLQVSDSSVALVQCTASSIGWRSGGFFEQFVILPAVTVTNVRLLVVRSTVTGGDTYCDVAFPLCFPVPAPPEPGIVTRNSILTIRGSTVLAGTRPACCPPDSVPAIRFDSATIQQGAQADLAASGGTPGQSLQIVLNSSVAAPFATYVSFPAPVIPVPVGFWLDLRVAIPVTLGVAPIGTRVDVLGVPNSIPLGLSLGLQAVLLSQGQLLLSTPTFKVLL